VKNSLILKQHLPYADMINRALDFSASMLSRSKTLYPFAVLSANNDMSCLFASNDNQYAESGLIEELQQQITQQNLLLENTIGVLVYSANVIHPNTKESDALVFTITDSQGHNLSLIHISEPTRPY